MRLSVDGTSASSSWSEGYRPQCIRAAGVAHGSGFCGSQNILADTAGSFDSAARAVVRVVERIDSEVSGTVLQSDAASASRHFAVSPRIRPITTI